MAKEITGNLDGEGLRVAIVVARFNELITTRLLRGALEGLESHEVKKENINVVWVPGSFEIPSVANTMAKSGDWDAIVCLGAVIRGETAHFDYVAGEAASGIARVSLDSGIPTIFGVLTTDNLEQAMERSGGKIGNKGRDAALGSIEMANLNILLKHR